ncbi:hypothetical protein [Bordetella bronchiseptica]|uniref:phage tail terminator protein n=1 Tax=Bordetella bronchiseptica TaxID=518 RepID=UPI00190F5267|nr:hypothetical protein [Bordetella bronchiseptica]
MKKYAPVFSGRVAAGLDVDVVLNSGQMPMPAAYVVMAEDDAGDLLSQTSYMQAISDSIDVVVVLNVRDEAGHLNADQLHHVRAELLRALAGWEPGPGYDGLVYNGGDLIRLDRARCSYRYSFSAEFQLGRAGSDGADPPPPAETWQEFELDGLPKLEGVTLRLDAIDPMTDPNIKRPGPDGRIEHEIRMELPDGQD